MTMITPSYLGETIEYSSLHACRSTLEDPTAYNVGSGAFNRSHFLKLLNEGKHVQACRGMLAYDHTRTKGRVRGLTNRREAEDKLCETIDLQGAPVLVTVPLAPSPALDDTFTTTATADFCSGSGQGADCPRAHLRVRALPKVHVKPAEPVCQGFWIFRTCTLNGNPI